MTHFAQTSEYAGPDDWESDFDFFMLWFMLKHRVKTLDSNKKRQNNNIDLLPVKNLRAGFFIAFQ